MFLFVVSLLLSPLSSTWLHKYFYIAFAFFFVWQIWFWEFKTQNQLSWRIETNRRKNNQLLLFYLCFIDSFMEKQQPDLQGSMKRYSRFYYFTWIKNWGWKSESINENRCAIKRKLAKLVHKAKGTIPKWISIKSLEPIKGAEKQKTLVFPSFDNIIHVANTVLSIFHISSVSL